MDPVFLETAVLLCAVGILLSIEKTRRQNGLVAFLHRARVRLDLSYMERVFRFGTTLPTVLSDVVGMKTVETHLLSFSDRYQ